MKQSVAQKNSIWHFIKTGNLIIQILIGLVIGALIAVIMPDAVPKVKILGDLFVGALKAIAPVVVFVLIIAAISNHQHGTKTQMTRVILLYIVGTLTASVVTVILCRIFPVTLILDTTSQDVSSAPKSAITVILNLVVSMVSNPVTSLTKANYISILFWGILFGMTLRKASSGTKLFLSDLAVSVGEVVRFIVRFAPLGVIGLMANSIQAFGAEALWNYVQILALLLGSMVFVALVVNPIIVWTQTRENPYPLVWKCISVSGLNAFFTRSSAANIPVNLNLCKEMGLDEETYSISIPIGATINMSGAAITIAVLTLAAVNTLGIEVSFLSMFVLCVTATLAAGGASGVAGGSLLLIPLACSLFGISEDIAGQLIGVGYIIAVLQDSTETALNSSTDVIFTAAAIKAGERKS